MTNADARLCARCGARRGLNACSVDASRHCRNCHEEHNPLYVAPTQPGETCRDCAAVVDWYAPDGTPFCGQHGKAPAL